MLPQGSWGHRDWYRAGEVDLAIRAFGLFLLLMLLLLCGQPFWEWSSSVIIISSCHSL
jgi:hypothetical protein